MKKKYSMVLMAVALIAGASVSKAEMTEVDGTQRIAPDLNIAPGNWPPAPPAPPPPATPPAPNGDCDNLRDLYWRLKGELSKLQEQRSYLIEIGATDVIPDIEEQILLLSERIKNVGSRYSDCLNKVMG